MSVVSLLSRQGPCDVGAYLEGCAWIWGLLYVSLYQGRVAVWLGNMTCLQRNYTRSAIRSRNWLDVVLLKRMKGSTKHIRNHTFALGMVGLEAFEPSSILQVPLLPSRRDRVSANYLSRFSAKSTDWLPAGSTSSGTTNRERVLIANVHHSSPSEHEYCKSNRHNHFRYHEHPMTARRPTLEHC